MRPASLRALHLLLLLVGLSPQAPRAQGRPLKATDPYCEVIVTEITGQDKPASSSQDLLDPEDQQLLRQHNLLRPNLDAFLKATENFQEKGLGIKRSLEGLQACLPATTATPTANPIQIRERDWDDFWSKLSLYLRVFDEFLTFKKRD